MVASLYVTDSSPECANPTVESTLGLLLQWKLDQLNLFLGEL